MFDERTIRDLERRIARLEAMELVPRTGTFTPTFGGNTTDGTFTYSIQTGAFLRVGTLCHIAINLAAATRTAAATGTRAQIKGLPFNPAQDTAIAVGFAQSVSASAFYAIARPGSVLEFHDTAGVVLPASVWLATSFIILSGTYLVA
jgi:hypothetical protein